MRNDVLTRSIARSVHDELIKARGGDYWYHDGTHRTGMKGNVLVWRAERGRWVMPVYLRVSEYARDIIRFRNDPYPGDIIRKVWPFFFPEAPKFELSVHVSEITTDFIRTLIRFAEANAEGRAGEFEWPLFPHGPAHYAWSKKGSEIYDQRRAVEDEAERRRINARRQARVQAELNRL